MVQNISDLEPVVPNETRWSGVYRLFNRFHRLRDSMVVVAKNYDSTLTVSCSMDFRNKVNCIGKMFGKLIHLQKCTVRK